MVPGEIYAPSTSMLWSVDCLTDRAAELRQRFPGKKIALTEWNASGMASAPIRALAGGLQTALGLCQIVRSGWDAATYYCLFCNFYQPHALVVNNVNAPRLRPSGWAFKGIKEHSKRYVLETTSTYRGIYACAFGDTSSSDGALVVVNRTDKAESVRVTLPKTWKRKVAIYEMTAASLNVDNENGEQRDSEEEKHHTTGVIHDNDLQVPTLLAHDLRHEALGEGPTPHPPASSIALRPPQPPIVEQTRRRGLRAQGADSSFSLSLLRMLPTE